MPHESHHCLSGLWTGVYDYAAHDGEATPFHAIIAESRGALSGESIEPNTVATDGGEEIFASFDGARDAAAVSFTKTYEKRPGAGHSVVYCGVANADLTCISGEWRIDDGLGGSGPFVMNRAEGGAAIAWRTEAARLLLTAPEETQGGSSDTIGSARAGKDSQDDG